MATPKEIEQGSGVGSQLWRMLSSLGIEHKPECSCLLLAEVMNDLGPRGCRKNRVKLLGLMRKNQERFGWATYLRVGVKALSLSWVYTLNPLDPLPGLLDRAIKLARIAEQQCQKSHGLTV